MRLFRFADLQVIGYADVLGRAATPTAVPPIFRVRREPDRVVMPPYRFVDDAVHCDIVGNQLDFARAIQQNNATALPRPRAARPNHFLWVDQDRRAHYCSVAHNGLLRLARARWRQAVAAFMQRDFRAAETAVGVVISADDTQLNAFAMKAALRQLAGEGEFP